MTKSSASQRQTQGYCRCASCSQQSHPENLSGAGPRPPVALQRHRGRAADASEHDPGYHQGQHNRPHCWECGHSPRPAPSPSHRPGSSPASGGLHPHRQMSPSRPSPTYASSFPREGVCGDPPGKPGSRQSVECFGDLGTCSIEVPGVLGEGKGRVRLQGHTTDLFQGQRRSFGGDRLMGRAARGSACVGEQVSGKPSQGPGPRPRVCSAAEASCLWVSLLCQHV